MGENTTRQIVVKQEVNIRSVKTTKIRITVVYPDKAASFIDRDTKHSVRRGGCRARKRIIYGNF